MLRWWALGLLLQLVVCSPVADLGEGFAGVVSTRNFEGEGNALQDIDAALATEPSIRASHARSAFLKAQAVRTSTEYDDGHASHVKTGHVVKDVNLSVLDSKLLPGIRTSNNPTGQIMTTHSEAPKQSARAPQHSEGGDDDSHEDDKAPKQAARAPQHSEGGDDDSHEDDKASPADQTHPNHSGAKKQADQDDSCNSPAKECDPEHCLCKQMPQSNHHHHQAHNEEQVQKQQDSSSKARDLSTVAILDQLNGASSTLSKLERPSVSEKATPETTSSLSKKATPETTSSLKSLNHAVHSESVAQILDRIHAAETPVKLVNELQ